MSIHSMAALKKLLFTALLGFGFICSQSAFAAMHLSLSGNHSLVHAGYQTIESGGASASVAFDLGSYFRLGLTHRQENSSAKGHIEDEKTKELHTYESQSYIMSNSLDFTVVLYAGEIFMPYIFVGYGTKYYHIRKVESGVISDDRNAGPGPNGGAGFAISLSKNFSLKISHTLSSGVTKDANHPELEGKSAVDGYTQAGISYAL